MHYIIHYDIAALVLLITIGVLLCTKLTIVTKLTQIFSIFLIVTEISNIFDLLSVYTITRAGEISLATNYVVNILYLLSFNFSAVIYCLYTFYLSNGQKKLVKKEKLLICIPAVMQSLLIMTTPFTRFIIYIDENFEYHHGPLMILLYFIALYYILLALGRLIYFKNRLTREQNLSIFFYSFGCIIAIILQMMIDNLLIIQFAISVSVLVVYHSLENPLDFSDSDLGTYNWKAMTSLLNRYGNTNRCVRIYGFKLKEMKYINATFGAEATQGLLKAISDYLLSLDRKNVKVFYLGNDVFALMKGIEVNSGQINIQQIQSALHERFLISGTPISLDAAFCETSFPDKIVSSDEIFQILELGFQISETNGDILVALDKESIEEIRKKSNIIQIMKQALKEHKFQVYYQPILRVEDKTFCSAEALIRLIDPDMGFISPDVFIPLAEENGMILEIGEYVFREVCRFIKETDICSKGIDYIHVNLSTVQCMQEDMAEQLIQIMDEYGLPYNRIDLEITETAAVLSEETLRRNMDKLLSKGMTFSLDDYGTGFSNVTSVIQYPFQVVKLDKSMVWAAIKDEKAMIALKHTARMINDLGMIALAEGVETLDQAMILEFNGVDMFQGYYYSKPIPGDVLLEFLEHAEVY